MSLNRVVFIGRLTRDVEMQTVGGDIPKAKFTLAVDRNYKSRGEERPKADFVPVVAWRKSAEFAERYFSKGKQVYVSGALETYTYEKNGENRGGFVINADEIGFADSMRGNDTEQNHENSEFGDFSGSVFLPSVDFGAGDDGELPF